MVREVYQQQKQQQHKRKTSLVLQYLLWFHSNFIIVSNAGSTMNHHLPLSVIPTGLEHTTCPTQSVDIDNDKYHHCHRVIVSDNAKEKARNRHELYLYLQQFGTIRHVPNIQSIVCPLQQQQPQPSNDAVNNNNNNRIFEDNIGLDTTWVVENRASTPIVLSHIDDETGLEVSAVNGFIYPAIRDPDSILQPGEWISINTYEGHIFIARSIISMELGMVGPVLLQHRVGLIPIGNPNLAHPYHDCQTDNPITTETTPEPQSHQKRIDFGTGNDECNPISIGFRNMINCPIHGYYVDQTNHEDDTNHDITCSDEHLFHIGTQNHQLNDFMYDYQSNVRYEETFIGHTFRFRLASNPDIIVDTITIQPTFIYDCPSTTAQPTTMNAVTTTNISSSIVINEMGEVIGNTKNHQHMISNITASTPYNRITISKNNIPSAADPSTLQRMAPTQILDKYCHMNTSRMVYDHNHSKILLYRTS
jgi:hypothetical protein